MHPSQFFVIVFVNMVRSIIDEINIIRRFQNVSNGVKKYNKKIQYHLNFVIIHKNE